MPYLCRLILRGCYEVRSVGRPLEVGLLAFRSVGRFAKGRTFSLLAFRPHGKQHSLTIHRTIAVSACAQGKLGGSVPWHHIERHCHLPAECVSFLSPVKDEINVVRVLQ